MQMQDIVAAIRTYCHECGSETIWLTESPEKIALQFARLRSRSTPVVVVMDALGYEYCVQNEEVYPPNLVRIVIALGPSHEFPHVDCFVCCAGKVVYATDVEAIEKARASRRKAIPRVI